MRLWKIQPKKAEISIEPLCTAGLHTDWIHSVSTADGSLVASGADDNSIALYDVQAQRLVGRVRIFSGAFCVVLSPNGHWLFSASGDIRVWSAFYKTQDFGALGQWGMVTSEHSGDYQHPRLVHLAGPGEDGYMAMEYQDVLRQGKKLACHPPCPKTALVSICGEIELTVSTSCSLALSSDDRRAVTCSWDKALRLFDVDTGQLLLVVTQVSDWVVKGFGATLAGDSAGLCVSYAWDQQLQLWDLGLSARGSGCRVVEAKDAPERLCACQCDASLVRMACAPRWTEGVRRSLAFSDEEGAVHFFKVELVPPASGE
eukprot:g8989.t1